MPYIAPTFNLDCRIFDYVLPPGPLIAPRLTSPCNLQFGPKKAVGIQTEDSFNAGLRITMWLLLPALTDVRPSKCFGYDTNEADIIEVPAGSGRGYLCLDADDVGKGFVNEYRVAVLQATAAWGTWPIPIP